MSFAPLFNAHRPLTGLDDLSTADMTQYCTRDRIEHSGLSRGVFCCTRRPCRKEYIFMIFLVVHLFAFQPRHKSLICALVHTVALGMLGRRKELMNTVVFKKLPELARREACSMIGQEFS